MTAPAADPAHRDAVAAAFTKAGIAPVVIQDSPGFILQRMRAMIANLGCEMAQIALATPADIDTAMKLGLNYPMGPLEIAEEMGGEADLRDPLGDPRRHPGPALPAVPMATPPGPAGAGGASDGLERDRFRSVDLNRDSPSNLLKVEQIHTIRCFHLIVIRSRRRRPRCRRCVR